jgi:hypothetical protein
MQLKLPRIEIKSQEVELPKLDLPKVELPKLERPKVDAPKIDLPKVELHRPELPNVEFHRPEMPDLAAAGAAAGKAISETVDSAGKAISDTVDSVGERIGSLGRDVRSIRITRRPESNVAGTAGLALLGGLGTGMALMFFFDPEQGRRRRVLLRDKLVRWSNQLSRTLSGRAVDLQNRTTGLAHTVRSATSGRDESWPAEAPMAAAASVTSETPYSADQLESADAAAGRDASRQEWQPVAMGSESTGHAAADEWGNVRSEATDATIESPDYPSTELAEQEREKSRSEI